MAKEESKTGKAPAVEKTEKATKEAEAPEAKKKIPLHELTAASRKSYASAKKGKVDAEKVAK